MSSRDERGQTAVLVVGLFLVALLLVVVVVDASAAYLRRQQLDALADGAALAAADAVAGEQVYLGGLGERAALDPVLARRHVREHLRQVGAFERHPGLRTTVQVLDDRVRVRVSAPLALPFAPPGWLDEATVTGRAAAYVRVGG